MFTFVALFPALSDEAPPIRPANPNAPVQSHSSSRSLISEQVITPIKVIIMGKDEAKLAEYLSGEGAQTLIDAVHEVCPRVRLLNPETKADYIDLFPRHLNLGPSLLN